MGLPIQANFLKIGYERDRNINGKPMSTDDHPLEILVVEDNPGDLRFLVERLRASERDGLFPAFSSTEFETLVEGLNHLKTRTPDLIILDLTLPDCKGLDTFQGFHHRVPKVPIVVLTNTDEEDIGLQAVQEGAQDFLIKEQVERRQLARSLRYAMERQRIRNSKIKYEL
jgi:CheY-like chemotaxis protein